MHRLRHLFPRTIRGQITVIILAALVTIIATGGALENWVKDDYAEPDIQEMTRGLNALAQVMRSASSSEREAMVSNAQKVGWDLSVAPISVANEFTHSSRRQSFIGAAADRLFPPSSKPPLGGWRTFLHDRRVIAAQIDDSSILILSGFPDTILTSAFLGRGPYYFTAVVVLIVFFFIFAIGAITKPIKRIAEAAAISDISDGEPVFAERGSIEIEALARALNGMRARIRSMVEGRTRMLRGIGHDLRTPLTRLKLRVERMNDDEHRDALLSDIDRIDALLAQTLNYLRNDSPSEAIELADIASILQTICSEFVDVGYDVAYVGPNKLVADCRPLSLTRAITNLCDNAVKFATKVEVRLTDKSNAFEICVEDNGPGISEKLRDRVLEPFFKADVSRSASLGGFGLGLSIVDDIVRSHHGTLELLQCSPSGLRARIEIPK